MLTLYRVSPCKKQEHKEHLIFYNILTSWNVSIQLLVFMLQC